MESDRAEDAHQEDMNVSPESTFLGTGSLATSAIDDSDVLFGTSETSLFPVFSRAT